MGSPMAGYGAAGVGAGTALNAVGQAQGLDAMRKAWRDQAQAQAGFDSQLSARTAELINGVGLDKATGSEKRAAVGKQMEASTRNAVAAQGKAAGRKRGGARGGAEARAVSAQANQGGLMAALRDGRLASILAGMQSGGQNMDMLGRTYGMEAGNIRGDASRYLNNVAPLQQQAAGMNGQALRGIGSLFNTLGQGAMMYGMSQPAGGIQKPLTDNGNGLGVSGPSGGIDGMIYGSQPSGPSIYGYLEG
jgi:hypothetical protein